MSYAILERWSDADLKLVLKIRLFEQGLLQLFHDGKLNGTTHTCLGQEYIPVACKPFLQQGDMEFSNHRGHGHFLARFGDFQGLLAEIMGKRGAICSGVGGSQHIYIKNQYLSTGIQGESMGVALGVGLHAKRRGKKDIAIVHIGDGTWGEGCVYESLNMAKLYTLPILVIVENNEIAQTTSRESNMAGSIEQRVRGFDVCYQKIESRDLGEIRTAMAPIFSSIRATSTPWVVEFLTPRLGPHSKGDDTRNPTQMDIIRQTDWYVQYVARYSDQLTAIEAEARLEIDHVLADVSQREGVQWNG
jgi:TPP-dependent pyruvate/acetoin dehydrogenase alpha subunit